MIQLAVSTYGLAPAPSGRCRIWASIGKIHVRCLAKPMKRRFLLAQIISAIPLRSEKRYLSRP